MAITESSPPQMLSVPGTASSSTEELPELLTVQEAARFLKVTVSWIYEHVRPQAQDRLPVVKLGKYLRFDARDLRAYVDAKRVESTRVRVRR